MTSPHSWFDVSVVVPAYESSRWIDAALAAIAAQTLAPREVIVVDDGSADDTAARAERAGAIVLRQGNQGPSAARNAGIRRARGTWIAFCDADDVWDPRMLERHADAFAACPEALLSFTDGSEFDEGGTLRQWITCRDRAYKRIKKTKIADRIYRLDHTTLAHGFYQSPFILMQSVAARRDAILGVGSFDEGLRVAEDYDLFLRLVARGTVVAVEDQLVHLRKHANNITRDETVNTEWHRKFWLRIVADPKRYPVGAEQFLRDDRVRRLARAGEFAVRVGRFSEGKAYLAEALRLRPTPRNAAFFGAALLCNNPAGRRVHRALRRRWRSSAWRYASPSRPRYDV